MLKLVSHHLPTLDSTFSLSLVYCSSPTLPTCASHSCIHCLAVFLLTLLIFPFSHLLHFRYPHSHIFCTSNILINAMFPDSIYKTPFYVCIQHVQISTLILILIVYSTSLQTSKFWFPYFWRYTLAFIWSLCSPLFGYAQFQINFWTSSTLSEIFRHVIVGS